MANEDLRSQADALDARIKAGRPGRHRTRIWRLGRLFIEGRFGLTMELIGRIARGLEVAGEKARAAMLDLRLLEQHGYEIRVQRDGSRLVFSPSRYPDGPPPGPGSVFDVPGESSSGGMDGGIKSGQGAIGEARRQVEVGRDFADWQADVRKFDVWTQSQEERTWIFGQAMLRPVVEEGVGLARVRDAVAADGDRVEIELWSDAELRADYPEWDVGTVPAAQV